MWQNLTVLPVKHTVKDARELHQKVDAILKVKHDESVSTQHILDCDKVTSSKCVSLPAGVLDRVDRLIFSLGLGSGGYDYSVITEPAPVSPAPTSPSNTTRRRRQTQEFRCPANGRNGEICLDLSQGLACINSHSGSIAHVFSNL